MEIARREHLRAIRRLGKILGDDRRGLILSEFASSAVSINVRTRVRHYLSAARSSFLPELISAIANSEVGTYSLSVEYCRRAEPRGAACEGN